ncbi:MAG: aminotransferase class I/II-fold pyridoxal phosphate-dependent enzyme, partial [Lachnospiraceae bacterium]|nr:aminotransferase class I/II-fold pyridoxal phosphate-dependent enzyme [Lachnospiraceae bacterium]
MSEYHHGGEIYDKEVRLDFSVNINPLGLAKGVREALIAGIDDLTHYPDQDCTGLTQTLSVHWGVPEEQILIGAGASDLLRMATGAIMPRAAMICAPTFSGYARALSMIGCKIIYHYLKKENQYALDEDFLASLQEHPETEMVFLCQPNNPVGNCIDAQLLRDIASYCSRQHIYLVVDECFLPFVKDGKERSMVAALSENAYLIV